MLSSTDLERLIAEKRREIEMEKSTLGLSPPSAVSAHIKYQENESVNPEHTQSKKKISFSDEEVIANEDINTRAERKESEDQKNNSQEDISAGLERYIRRYLGLPVMLKAGEFSPNNPILREERTSGDVLLGLGEYERRRNTLRKIRQQQYREYLDQQAKKKQEEKERAEKVRRELEEKERLKEEKIERLRQELEENKPSPEQRRASVCYVDDNAKFAKASHGSKIDTAVQVGANKPLSVAVQTDDTELYGLSPQKRLTTAERELSPRTVGDKREQRDHWDDRRPDWDQNRDHWTTNEYFNEPIRNNSTNRGKLIRDLRHTYMPSILDSDAIRLRNLHVEKEAAEQRQCYQQELKHQIEEQQRIREERKTREKMLEQAEMRRMEEQLRMLRMAQEKEVLRHHDINDRMRDGASDFENQRNILQREIEYEQQKLRSKTQHAIKRNIPTSRSDNSISKLPFYYPNDEYNKTKPSYSTNIPEDSIFSPTYDVDSYLRKNLNPSKDVLLSNRLDTRSTEASYNHYDLEFGRKTDAKNGGNKIDMNENEPGAKLRQDSGDCDRRIVVEKAQIHDRPKDKLEKPQYEPSFLKRGQDIERSDETPIPVLRHSPKVQNVVSKEDLSENIRLLDDKWKVPVVQKNILKTLPSEEGKTVSILTQLGSIRRQLQLEQMRLDNLKGNSK